MHRFVLAALAVALLLTTQADPVAADCGDCPEPSIEQIMAHPDFPTEAWKRRHVRNYHYLNTDAGECRVRLAGPIYLQKGTSWYVLRGQGEVWDCPHSSSQDTVTIEANQADSTGWNITASGGGELSAVVAAVKASITAGRTTGTTITEVTRVSKADQGQVLLPHPMARLLRGDDLQWQRGLRPGASLLVVGQEQHDRTHGARKRQRLGALRVRNRDDRAHRADLRHVPSLPARLLRSGVLTREGKGPRHL